MSSQCGGRLPLKVIIWGKRRVNSHKWWLLGWAITSCPYSALVYAHYELCDIRQGLKIIGAHKIEKSSFQKIRIFMGWYIHLQILPK